MEVTLTLHGAFLVGTCELKLPSLIVWAGGDGIDIVLNHVYVASPKRSQPVVE